MPRKCLRKDTKTLITKYNLSLYTFASYLYILQRGYMFGFVNEYVHFCHDVKL